MFDFFDISIFYKKIKYNNNFQKIICFDFGTKKLGIALTDSELNFAFPKEVCIGNWMEIENTCKKILEICKKYDVKNIVIGFPKKMNNTLEEKSDKIIKIAEKLSENDFNILLFDERFSTKTSNAIIRFEESFIKNSTTKNAKNKFLKIQKSKQKYDDARSASIILNDTLTLLKNMKKK